MTNILYIGDLNDYGRGFQRWNTLKKMGIEVDAFSHTHVSNSGTFVPPTISFRIFNKLKIPIDPENVNHNLIQAASRKKFDIIWIEKGNMVKPWTLKKLKKINSSVKLISCSEDDMYVSHGHSYWYKKGLKYYDIVFTTKVYNLNELYEFNAKKTELFLDSFDEDTHYPMELSVEEFNKYSSEVCAIGAFEPERAESMLFLAKNGVNVTVWGMNWREWKGKHPNLDIKDEFLFGKEYSKAICASKVNLNFLRKINRDEVTSRSVEIPACGGFMIAERTNRHKEFFKESKEAEFFDSDQELLEKVQQYLSDDNLRKNVAKAGMDRCVRSRYSMRDQLENIINTTLNL